MFKSSFGLNGWLTVFFSRLECVYRFSLICVNALFKKKRGSRGTCASTALTGRFRMVCFFVCCCLGLLDTLLFANATAYVNL